jgi:hypothetical protein
MKALILFWVMEMNSIMMACSTYKDAVHEMNVLQNRAYELKEYVQKNGYSSQYAFLIDMKIPSGRKRFFVYDMENDSIITSGLVAHGSCEVDFLKEARFSNKRGGGCSSLGKYKVGHSYTGQYGKAFKLFGLDPSNSNAFERAVVLHAYTCVPDEEIYPHDVCNSMGCPMISYHFLEQLSTIIKKSDKPIVLWIFK